MYSGSTEEIDRVALEENNTQVSLYNADGAVLYSASRSSIDSMVFTRKPVADVLDGGVLSQEPSATYAYYQSNIKPKPAAPAGENGKKRWVCTVCGYVYEGEELPADFICPLCKHPASDFELLK